MDKTIIDNVGRGVESCSLTCSALGIGGRSDVGDLTPRSSSWLVNMEKILGRIQEVYRDCLRESGRSEISPSCCIPSALGTPNERLGGDDI